VEAYQRHKANQLEAQRKDNQQRLHDLRWKMEKQRKHDQQRWFRRYTTWGQGVAKPKQTFRARK